jgi:hypothetical protein
MLFLEEGQYPLAFFFLVAGIPLFEAALDAVVGRVAFFYLFAFLFLNSEVAVRVGDGASALIALDFT